MKNKVLLFLVLAGGAVGVGVAWVWPVHKANLLLQELSRLKPGITHAAEIESLAGRGLLKKVDGGCIGGFENTNHDRTQRASSSRTVDVCYSFMVRNTIPSVLHLAPATGVYGTLNITNTQLELVLLTFQRGWLFFSVSDQACYSCTPKHSDYFVDRQLSGVSGVAENTHVYLTIGSSEQQRRAAYAIDTNILASIGSNKDGRHLNSAVWTQ